MCEVWRVVCRWVAATGERLSGVKAEREVKERFALLAGSGYGWAMSGDKAVCGMIARCLSFSGRRKVEVRQQL